MNIAFLIGISEYSNLQTLSACKNDVEQMYELLNTTKKYDQITILKGNVSSNDVKEKLRQFFESNKTNSIDEVFIYFSGHGTFRNDEVLLCCSDFKENLALTTSLANTELDDLLKSVNPRVVIKVIDACQSGSMYIKDSSSNFEKALQKSTFNSFICMASSRNSQNSFATENASFFTSSWIAAVGNKQEGRILYRDIQAYIADAFSENKEQTPIFVSQGTGLEQFCAVTDDIRSFISAYQKQLKTPIDSLNSELGIEDKISSYIQKNNQNFITFEKAVKSIELCMQDLSAYQPVNKLISKGLRKQTH